ncbi:MAG TPA: DHH family phosphoesterase, partial [archaeon]|nr:DHH family phosphoesterase [archaeon]
MRQSLNASESVELLKELKGSIALMCHDSPDVDAVASMLALKDLLSVINPSLEAVAVQPPHVGPQVRELLSRVSRSFDSKFETLPANTDSVALLDTFSKDLTSYAGAFFQAFKGKALIIDHHRGEADVPIDDAFLFLGQDSISTTQLVLRLFEAASVEPSSEAAELICMGLITDSAFFATANSRAFSDLSAALGVVESRGRDYAKVLSTLRTQQDSSERIAKFKALQRAKVYRVGGYLVAVSEVGSFEASAATALVKVGADFSFVLSEGRDGFVISSRASTFALSSSKVDLGVLLSGLAKELHGTGG